MFCEKELAGGLSKAPQIPHQAARSAPRLPLGASPTGPPFVPHGASFFSEVILIRKHFLFGANHRKVGLRQWADMVGQNECDTVSPPLPFKCASVGTRHIGGSHKR